MTEKYLLKMLDLNRVNNTTISKSPDATAVQAICTIYIAPLTPIQANLSKLR